MSTMGLKSLLQEGFFMQHAEIFRHRDRISPHLRRPRRSAARWFLAAALVASAPATAASAEPNAADERMSVASHIPGSDGGVRPVRVITRHEIERSGAPTVADLVSNLSAYNYFGTYRSQLAGVVIMIDGRPALTLNSLPTAAVERIEFISDGASALHAGGSVGAINVVLRRDLDGAIAWAGAERPGEKGGAIENVSALWGGKIGRGRLTIGVDGFRRGEIRRRDRAYSRASWTEGGSFDDTVGVSVGGNTLFATDGKGTDDDEDDVTIARSLGACSGGGYTGPLSRPESVPGAGCGYAWANIAWEDDQRRLGRYGLFANFDHPIGKGATFYAAVRFSQGQTKFRYAPPVGRFSIDYTDDPSDPNDGPSAEELAFRTQFLASPDLDLPSDFNPNTVTALTVRHRFTAHGNRDWTTDLLEYDLTTGLRGRLWGGVGYDVHLRSRHSSSLRRGGNFVSRRLITAAVVDGSYYLEDPLNPPDDRAAAHRQAVRDTTLRMKNDAVTQVRTARLALNGPGPALLDGTVRWAGGLEVDHLEQRSILTFTGRSGIHDVSDVLGQGGASYSGERLRRSAFGELRLPLRRDWTVALAARYDSYDDVGPAWSYQAATVYRPHKILSVRGSWEVGLTAPSLYDLHGPVSEYFPRVCDTKSHTGPLADCPTPQVNALTGGNPELEPYPTETWTIGAKATLGRLSVSADWFRSMASDAPGSLSAQKIVDIDAGGGTLPPGAAVNREGNRIKEIVNPILNSAESETSGLDVRAGARWKFDELDSGFDLRWLHLLDHEARVGGIKQPGDLPRNRVHATLSAGPGLRGDGWVVDWNVRAISEFSNAQNSGRFETWIGHDIGLDWRNIFGVRDLTLRGGVFNLGDAAPSADTSNPASVIKRYDAVRGRTFYLSLKAKW